MGVLSAVLTLKNTPQKENEEADERMEEELEMVRVCTSNCPPASALFMDELAATILRDGINTSLESWLSAKLQKTFEDVFIQDLEASDAPFVTQHTQLHMEVQFDAETEDDAQIAVNIGMMVEKLEHLMKGTGSLQELNSDSYIVTLCPHFRLLRMVLCHLNEGNLADVDGLLGCPVYYPSQEHLTRDGFASLTKPKQSVILSCLFFTANWFRELINAFATQKEPSLKKKVSFPRRVNNASFFFWGGLRKLPEYYFLAFFFFWAKK